MTRTPRPAITSALPNLPPRHVLCIAIAQAVLGLSTVHADIIDIDSFSDVTSEEDCILRDAITSANMDQATGGCAAGSGDDTITFDGLTTPATIALTNGEIRINTSIDIIGPGAENLSISAGNNSRIFRIDDEDTATMQNVSLAGLTLTDGQEDDGGAIDNRENLAVSSSVFSGNVATSSPAFGGAIWNTNGTLTITNSVFSGNSATRGAGVYNWRGDVTISDSVISGNTGTGLTSNGTLDVVNCSIHSNIEGGGLQSWGTTSVTDSFIYENSSYSGGGLGSQGSSSHLTVQNSTISDNTAMPGSGAGIQIAQGATLTLINSTVSGNSAQRRGGGIEIFSSGSIANLHNVTIYNNTAVQEGGGGLFQNYGQATVNMTNTVIANSEAFNECNLYNVVFGAHVNNLIEDGTCADASAVNLLSGDPVLGPLQHNGGPTQTHAILAGSPLIDAGEETECSDYPTDQRGFSRHEDGLDNGSDTCDIGSYERISPVILRDSFEEP